MPKDKIIMQRAVETIESFKSAYMDVFSRCCDNREIGGIANELSISAANVISQLASSETNMNYYAPVNNEELVNLVFDSIRMIEALDKATFTKIDPILAQIITNQQMALDIAFASLIWDRVREQMRPDITTSIFENLDEETREKISLLTDRLMLNVSENIGVGFGVRPLKNGSCTRDCTKCPLAQNFSIKKEDVALYTRAKCPIFLGRQSLLTARVFAQNQVAYRTAMYPFVSSTGMSFSMEKKMLEPIKYFNDRVEFLMTSLDNSFEDIREEENASMTWYMGFLGTNMSDIVISYAKGQVPSYVPERLF